MATDDTTDEKSLFQSKLNDFIDDLLGALPEYKPQLEKVRLLDENIRLERFHQEVRTHTLFEESENDFLKNPVKILPDITLSDSVWNSLSEQTKKAIWEHIRILSICCFMECNFKDDSKPSWMDDAMNELKTKLESTDFQNIIKKFMTFFNSTSSSTSDEKKDTSDEKNPLPNFDKFFENGFPKLPEKFLKGHLARLAQEIVKDITPQDLGISDDMISQCEKDPSRAFTILFSTFTNNPSVIQRTISKIGKRLQQKITSGAIRPQEIAREAEELMKEFSSNSSFVEMMEGIKSAFGFEDMDLARKAGKESSARLSIIRDRLRKKLEKKQQNPSSQPSSNGKKK
jgi:hypothetical protein